MIKILMSIIFKWKFKNYIKKWRTLHTIWKVWSFLIFGSIIQIIFACDTVNGRILPTRLRGISMDKGDLKEYPKINWEILTYSIFFDIYRKYIYWPIPPSASIFKLSKLCPTFCTILADFARFWVVAPYFSV